LGAPIFALNPILGAPNEDTARQTRRQNNHRGQPERIFEQGKGPQPVRNHRFFLAARSWFGASVKRLIMLSKASMRAAVVPVDAPARPGLKNPG
jgi:hypothetical protein